MWKMKQADYRELVIDSIRYWERMRIAYNLVLIVLAIYFWGTQILSGRAAEFFGGIFVLLLFAMAANLLYCTAYPVDIAMQLTPLRSLWHRCRWVLFLCGTLLASAISVWVLIGNHMA
jgi:hypothetical protein